MIASLDDSAKFRLPDLKNFHQFPNFGIITKLFWSKNVIEERDAPDQVLLGSFDQHYCALIGLGTWLEFHFSKNPEPNEYVFGIKESFNYKVIKKTKQHLNSEKISKMMSFKLLMMVKRELMV